MNGICLSVTVNICHVTGSSPSLVITGPPWQALKTMKQHLRLLLPPPVYAQVRDTTESDHCLTLLWMLSTGCLSTLHPQHPIEAFLIRVTDSFPVDGSPLAFILTSWQFLLMCLSSQTQFPPFVLRTLSPGFGCFLFPYFPDLCFLLTYSFSYWSLQGQSP